MRTISATDFKATVPRSAGPGGSGEIERARGHQAWARWSSADRPTWAQGHAGTDSCEAARTCQDSVALPDDLDLDGAELRGLIEGEDLTCIRVRTAARHLCVDLARQRLDLRTDTMTPRSGSAGSTCVHTPISGWEISAGGPRPNEPRLVADHDA